MIQNFKLIKKKKLTHNVYELIFECEHELIMKPWQFITFIINKIWWRAYSILELDWKQIKLIIKKRELGEWGRWWSILICNLNIWETLKWVWPAWHFLLQENNKNKMFIWTWTGFVPLYNQIQWNLINKQNCNLEFIFWAREKTDLFYINELMELKLKHKNFNFELFLSRWEVEWINKGYTINYLTKENCENFEEFYICWAPAMIESSIEKLKNIWFNDSNIFYEKY